MSESVERIEELLRSRQEAVRLQGRELALSLANPELERLLWSLGGNAADIPHGEVITVRLIWLRRLLGSPERP